MPAIINKERCSGCGHCVAACPLRLITLEPHGFRKIAVIMPPENCNSCAACAENCPINACRIIKKNS